MATGLAGPGVALLDHSPVVIEPQERRPGDGFDSLLV